MNYGGVYKLRKVMLKKGGWNGNILMMKPGSIAWPCKNRKLPTVGVIPVPLFNSQALQQMTNPKATVVTPITLVSQI